MIGAGAVGAGTAWHLSLCGHDVCLYDPRLDQPIHRSETIDGLTGTTASLGVLMGNIFRRSSGRGWRLRQRSMALWPSWIKALGLFDLSLKLATPLFQLADNESDLEKQLHLAKQRQNLGLHSIDPRDSPLPCLGGLQSNRDGCIDPLALQRALQRAIKTLEIQQKPARVSQLVRRGSAESDRWQVSTVDGQNNCHDSVVLCTAIGVDELLEPLGHHRPVGPVLGQAVELQLNDGPNDWTGWPAVLIQQGFNLIPKQPGRLLLGATVEAGDQAKKDPFILMRSLNNTAPNWLQDAEVVQHWSGLRARPLDRPAPLLEELEPGLILASGHYRNGILLTPATAEWVEQQLHKEAASTKP